RFSSAEAVDRDRVDFCFVDFPVRAFSDIAHLPLSELGHWVLRAAGAVEDRLGAVAPQSSVVSSRPLRFRRMCPWRIASRTADRYRPGPQRRAPMALWSSTSPTGCRSRT